MYYNNLIGMLLDALCVMFAQKIGKILKTQYNHMAIQMVCRMEKFAK